MESLAIVISGVGYACWDNVLVWMVRSDPDASFLHLHWLRMVFMTFCLSILSWSEKTPLKPFHWWLKFSLMGWVLPSIMYTLAVMWEGYRISVSFQTFIPLVVIWRTGTTLDEWRCAAIMLALCGTLVIWSSMRWHNELWIVWASVGASIVQILSTAEFFVMLCEIKQHKLRVITLGGALAVVIMFLLMGFIVHPKYLVVCAANNMNLWTLLLISCAVTAGVKFLLLVSFSEIMRPDGLAIFECVHPIATLVADILWERDQFGWVDGVAILFFLLGWILYPKMNI